MSSRSAGPSSAPAAGPVEDPVTWARVGDGLVMTDPPPASVEMWRRCMAGQMDPKHLSWRPDPLDGFAAVETPDTGERGAVVGVGDTPEDAIDDALRRHPAAADMGLVCWTDSLLTVHLTATMRARLESTGLRAEWIASRHPDGRHDIAHPPPGAGRTNAEMDARKAELKAEIDEADRIRRAEMAQIDQCLDNPERIQAMHEAEAAAEWGPPGDRATVASCLRGRSL